MSKKEYIEKAAVIEIFRNPAIDHKERAINRIPPAKVKPVMEGEWELDSDNIDVCSACGEIALQRVFVKVPHLIQDVRMVRSNFCPNCGADMRKEN